MSPSCLICAETKLRERYHGLRDVLGRSQTTYAFLQCQRCGSLSADPLPEPEEIASLYPEDYMFRGVGASSPFDRTMQQIFWWGYHRWVYTRAVASVLRSSQCRRGRLLDVGCGTGIHLRLFRQAGLEVEGIELSAKDCEHVRQTLGCPIHQGTLTDARLAPNQFDVITLFNVLEHLRNPRETVQAIWHLLKPGGWFFADIPVADGWQPTLFGRWWRNAGGEVPRHLALPSTRGCYLLLEELGFVQIQHRAGPLVERACSLATTLYPWGAAYRNAHRFKSPAIRLFNTGIGALLTYLAIPEAILESLAGRPSAVIVGGRRPDSAGVV